MKWIFGIVLLSVFGYANTLTVAVAANVSYAIEELKASFEEMYPETSIRIVLGSSGKLTAQIKNGAPYDVFMAANMKYPHALKADGIALTEPVVYAQGALAMFTLREVKLDSTLKTLMDTNVGKISLANPKTAPYGKASIEAFQKAGIHATIQPKLVYAETVTQSVQYAMTAADVGLIAKSTLYSDKMKQYKKGVHWENVDPKLYTPINQGIVVLKQAEKKPDAKAFYDFMLGEKARMILKDYGYLLP